MTKLSPARALAFDVLVEAEQRDAFVRDLLASRVDSSSLDVRDRGFASALALGATASRGCLDEALDAYLSKPKKVSARVRCALRIAAFEMLYLDTPGRVAVSQGVELVRSCARSAAGLANAVLRRVDENRALYLDALDVAVPQREVAAAARRAALPLWLYREISLAYDLYGVRGFMPSALNPAPMAVHTNPHREPSESALALFGQEFAPGCYAVSDMRSLTAEPGLAEARLVVSDANAQLIATAATRDGSCLEIGAGRGTKTFVMNAQAHRAGLDHTHVALDLFEGKCELNRERMEQAGLGEKVSYAAGDACDLDAVLKDFDARAGERKLFDTVFVDAPCSGTGTMRRHPEIPWRLMLGEVHRELTDLQLALLRQAANRVVPGGELFYATCSVLPYENTDIIDAFLETPEGGFFELAPVSEASIFNDPGYEPARAMVESRQLPGGYFQSLPTKKGDFDAHFCARLIKRA